MSIQQANINEPGIYNVTPLVPCIANAQRINAVRMLKKQGNDGAECMINSKAEPRNVI